MVAFSAEIKNWTLYLSGPLTELVDFESVEVSESNGPIKINLKSLTWTNSIGVVKLRDFVRDKIKGEFHFIECPLDFIFQLETVPGLLAGGRGSVESIVLPFECSECDTESVNVIPSRDLRVIELKGDSPIKLCPCIKQCRMEYTGTINFAFLKDYART